MIRDCPPHAQVGEGSPSMWETTFILFQQSQTVYDIDLAWLEQIFDRCTKVKADVLTLSGGKLVIHLSRQTSSAGYRTWRDETTAYRAWRDKCACQNDTRARTTQFNHAKSTSPVRPPPQQTS